LYAQRTIWKSHGKKKLCWVFLVWMIRKTLMWNVFNHEMYFLYNSPILFCNPKTQERKGPILYNTSNEIISLIKKWICTILLLQKCWRGNEQSIEKRNGEIT
jgi:hypothetical protein